MEMKGLAKGQPLLPDTVPQKFARKRLVSSDRRTHTDTHTLMAWDDLSNYRREGPIGALKWGV